MPGAGTDTSRPAREGGPVIILVEPQLGENIGMAARAMANFGLTEMRLVRPRGNWKHQKTMATAANAAFVVDAAQVFPDLKSAIADLQFVYATTARERGQGKPVVGPQEAGTAMATRVAAGEKIGVLFGRERTGLENDDIAAADEILTFPVNPRHASLNLAQAVLLTGYAFAQGTAMPLPFTRKETWPPADRETVLSFFEYLEEVLAERGFFRPANKKPVMSRNLRNIFHRIGMSEQDVRTLRGMIVRLVEGPREPQTKKRRGPKQPPKGWRGEPEQG